MTRFDNISCCKNDKGGCTPFYFACEGDHLEIVRLLVTEGADKDKASKGSSRMKVPVRSNISR